MRILFLGAYWLGWDLLYHSLRNLNEHEIILIRYDPPRAGDKRIPELIQPIVSKIHIDVIIYVGVNGGICRPTFEELHILKNVAPTVFICPEAGDKTWWADYVRLLYEQNCFDLMVSIDGNPDWPYSDKGLTKLTPIDQIRWPNPPNSWIKRNILCGTWSNRCGPRETILSELGDRVQWRGNIPTRSDATEEVDNLASYELLVNFYNECKSVLNIAFRGGDGFEGKHVKGRVIEAGLAGSVLIENEGSGTEKWFLPGEDYLTYNTTADIIKSLKWIEDNPYDAQKMASQLRSKILLDHSPKVFWDDVFKRLSINIDRSI